MPKTTNEDDGMCLIHSGDEWRRMWREIRNAYGLKAVKSVTEPGFQYMGSERRRGRWFHCFRHRRLPEGQTAKPYTLPDDAEVRLSGEDRPDGSRRVYVDLPAPEGWEPQADVVV